VRNLAAEWDSRWRDDLAGFVTLQDIEAIVDRGVSERPPRSDVQFTAFLDASSGAGKDSFAARQARSTTPMPKASLS
jgi:hypothetical protein